jgi:holo-[acyl-carrier protein] synthase
MGLASYPYGFVQWMGEASPDGSYHVGSPAMQTKFAVGIDIIEIDRVADVLSRHGDRFLNRVYTADEIAHCRGRVSELAARFAAKEAVMKALGTGVRGVGWRDIEVLPNRRGKPLVFLYGLRGLEISLTHSKEYAIASVVGERELTEIEDTPRRGESALQLIREKGLR